MVADRPALEELGQRFRGHITTDPATCATKGQDGSGLRGTPAAVVVPSDAEDVVALVRWARATRTPLVARGGGSSLDGESVPPEGGVVVDFAGWTEVGPVDRLAGTVTVQPGVVNAALDRHLESNGLFFPPNPGSWRTSTIGGNVATNASGPRSFRYGASRSWVRTLEVVTGTGERWVAGSLAPKRSAGPSFLDLLVGSEGTLALTTSATLRLARRPDHRVGLVVPLRSAASPAALVGQLVDRAPEGLAAIEYIDQQVAEELSRREGARVPGDRPLVLLEVEAPDAELEGRLGRVELILRSSGLCEEATVYPDANRLWTLRGESGVVLDRTMGDRIREDVCVPLPRLAELFALLERLAGRFQVQIATFGHLGEGNLHPNIPLRPNSPEAAEFRGALLSGVHALGGTISGEHGIGRLKAPWVGLEHGPTGVALLRGIKSLFDPDGILNPGKIVA